MGCRALLGSVSTQSPGACDSPQRSPSDSHSRTEPGAPWGASELSTASLCGLRVFPGPLQGEKAWCFSAREGETQRDFPQRETLCRDKKLPMFCGMV